MTPKPKQNSHVYHHLALTGFAGRHPNSLNRIALLIRTIVRKTLLTNEATKPRII